MTTQGFNTNHKLLSTLVPVYIPTPKPLRKICQPTEPETLSIETIMRQEVRQRGYIHIQMQLISWAHQHLVFIFRALRNRLNSQPVEYRWTNQALYQSLTTVEVESQVDIVKIF